MNRKNFSGDSTITRKEAEDLHKYVASKHRHEVKDYASAELAEIINYHATVDRTKGAAIFISLLSTVSCIVGPVAKLRPVSWMPRAFCAALNLILIGTPNSGKSTALDNYSLRILNSMKAVYGKIFRGAPFTGGALRSLLKKSKGFVAIMYDEFAHLINKLSTDDGGAIGVLNKGWGGQSIDLMFKSEEATVELEKSSVSIFGTIHPKPMIHLLRNVWVDGNGFDDRCLISAIDDLISTIAQSGEMYKMAPAQNWTYDELFKALFEYVKQFDELVFTFSPEAHRYYEELSDSLLENRKNGTAAHNSTRIEDNAAKVSLNMHILEELVKSYSANGQVHLGTVISIETLKKAVKFVLTSGEATEVYLNGKPLTTIPAGLPSDRSMDLLRKIIQIAGAFVTARLFNEAHRKSSFLDDSEFHECILQLERLGMGRRQNVEIRKGFHLEMFYKEIPEKISAEKLLPFVLELEEYKSIFASLSKLAPTRRKELEFTLSQIRKDSAKRAPEESVPEEPERKKNKVADLPDGFLDDVSVF